MVHGKVLEVLSQGVARSDDMAMNAGLGSNLGMGRWKGKGRAGAAESEDTKVKQGFRKSMSKHLFGWDAIASWRVKLGLADYVWVSALLDCRQYLDQLLYCRNCQAVQRNR